MKHFLRLKNSGIGGYNELTCLIKNSWNDQIFTNLCLTMDTSSFIYVSCVCGLKHISHYPSKIYMLNLYICHIVKCSMDHVAKQTIYLSWVRSYMTCELQTSNSIFPSDFFVEILQDTTWRLDGQYRNVIDSPMEEQSQVLNVCKGRRLIWCIGTSLWTYRYQRHVSRSIAACIFICKSTIVAHTSENIQQDSHVVFMRVVISHSLQVDILTS